MAIEPPRRQNAKGKCGGEFTLAPWRLGGSIFLVGKAA
jgi:hypothetical protein